MVFKSSLANSVNPVTKAGTKAPLFICYSCLQKQRREETRQRHPPYPPLIFFVFEDCYREIYGAVK